MNFFNFAISFFFSLLVLFFVVSWNACFQARFFTLPFFFSLTTFSFVIFHLDLGWRASLVILSISHCRGYVQSTLHLHCLSIHIYYLCGICSSLVDNI